MRIGFFARPLRIAWAIHSEDRDSFRKAVRLTHTLWGGRFNPIVLVDRPEEAKQLIERFRADVIRPVGDAVAVKNFPKQFPYLINPFFRAMLHLPEKNRPSELRGTEARVTPRLQGTSELGALPVRPYGVSRRIFRRHVQSCTDSGHLTGALSPRSGRCREPTERVTCGRRGELCTHYHPIQNFQPQSATCVSRVGHHAPALVIVVPSYKEEEEIRGRPTPGGRH
jgi:hypothetical protein